MYTKQQPFKDFNGKPRTETVHFNLTEREVFKLLVEFKRIFDWYDRMQKGPTRELGTQEVVDFYTDLETVLLDAWGEPSDDGLHFRKGKKYEFEESALFNACMVEFVTNPGEVGKLLEDIMPKGMNDLVRKADDSMAELEKREGLDPAAAAEIARLRAQLEAAEAAQPAAVAPSA